MLCELIGVPAKSQGPEEIQAEFRQRAKDNEAFVLPITALIETGNHIAQAAGDRRGAAARLVKLMEAAGRNEEPFVLHETTWDTGFLDGLCQGDATGQPLVDLAGNGQMGTGDLAILVERDRFVRASSFRRQDVTIWTLDVALQGYA